MRMKRLDHIKRFYELLDVIRKKFGGLKELQQCHGRMPWPRGGVYFFSENGEMRMHSGLGLRVVRVGTHALTQKSKSSLWGRLSQHKGSEAGSGNHRGSIFRLIVGAALKRRDKHEGLDSWGIGASLTAASERTGMDRNNIKCRELVLERLVSQAIGQMPFIFLPVEGASDSPLLRAYIEKNAIALLSNRGRTDLIDPPSKGWLGLHSDRERVRTSGLWNNEHVDAQYDEVFLDKLEHAIPAN